MMYRGMIAVCSGTNTKHINALCVQNVELLTVKTSGTVHTVTTGLYRVKHKDVFTLPYIIQR
jgi:hypothetical protein